MMHVICDIRVVFDDATRRASAYYCGTDEDIRRELGPVLAAHAEALADNLNLTQRFVLERAAERRYDERIKRDGAASLVAEADQIAMEVYGNG